MNHDTPEEALHMVGARRVPSSFDWARVASLNAKIRGNGVALRLRVEFGDGETPPVRNELLCGHFQLWEGIKDAAAVARALRSEIPLEAGWARESFSNGHWNVTRPSEHWAWYSRRSPCFRLSTHLQACSDLLGGPEGSQLVQELESLPVAAASGECFVDVRSALQSWFQLPGKPGHNDLARGECEVIVPPDPGQVVALIARVDGRLELKLSPGLDVANLSVYLALDDEAESTHLRGEIQGESVVFPAVPCAGFCAYVFEEGHLKSFYRGDPAQGITPESTELTVSETESLVRGGESDRCEFKQATGGPWEWTDKFWAQFLRAITAFANARGGTIVVGVDDNAKVVGVKIGAEASDVERVENVIRNKCQQLIRHAPSVHARLVLIRERILIRVDVVSNAGRQVSYLDGKPLIRFGATSRVPTGEEHERFFGRLGGRPK